jgi:hypothetical protein
MFGKETNEERLLMDLARYRGELVTMRRWFRRNRNSIVLATSGAAIAQASATAVEHGYTAHVMTVCAVIALLIWARWVGRLIDARSPRSAALEQFTQDCNERRTLDAAEAWERFIERTASSHRGLDYEDREEFCERYEEQCLRQKRRGNLRDAARGRGD